MGPAAGQESTQAIRFAALEQPNNIIAFPTAQAGGLDEVADSIVHPLTALIGARIIVASSNVTHPGSPVFPVQTWNGVQSRAVSSDG